MPLILAIEPDRRQASHLTAMVRGRLHAELVLAESAERALAQLGDRVPDLVLTTALLSPKDEAALGERLRTLDGAAAHVQTLTIPVFATTTSRKHGSGGVLSALRRKSKAPAPDGCDPAVFAEQCATYLDRAAAERVEFDPPAKLDLASGARSQQKPPQKPPADFTSEMPPPPVEAPAASGAPSAWDPERAFAPASQSSAQPAVKQTPEPVDEPPAPSIFKAFEPEPAPAPKAAPASVGPLVKPADEPLIRPLDDVLDEPLVRPMDEPVVQPIDEPFVQPTVEPHVDPIDEPIAAAPHESPAEPLSANADERDVFADLSSALDLSMSDGDESGVIELPDLTADDLTLPETPEPLARAQDSSHRHETLAPPRAVERSIPLRLGVANLWPPIQGVLAERRPVTVSAPPIEPPAPAKPAVERRAGTKPAPRPRVVPQVVVSPPVPDPFADFVTDDIDPIGDFENAIESEPAFKAAPARAPAAAVSAAARKPAKKHAAKEKPVQDEWGLFDPDQCGFSALLEKLDEITAEKKPASKPRRGGRGD